MRARRQRVDPMSHERLLLRLMFLLKIRSTCIVLHVDDVAVKSSWLVR